MEYSKFLENKKISFIESGFEIDNLDLNPLLKDFQKHAVKVS